MGNAFGNVLDSMITAAKKNNPEREGDYIGENGLLYCGKCHTAKQCEFTALGVKRKVFCACKCAQEEKARAKSAEEEEQKRFERQRIREAAFSDRYTRACRFSNDDSEKSEVSRFSRKYAESFSERLKDGDGILFYGGCGTGKSFYAACICNDVIDRDFTAKFTSLSEIERELWSAGNKNDVYEYIGKFDLLVLDDFSSERNTSYMQEIGFDVVNARYKSRKPLVITTNLSPADVRKSELAQQRVFSRVLDACIPFAVIGQDRRIGSNSKNKTEYKIERILSCKKAH